MSNQLEHGETGKVPFRDLLNAAMPVIRSKPFIDTDSGEMITYAQIVQYKVQRDLFTLCEEEAPGTISWEDFVLVMRSSKELQDKCLDVIGRKLETAFFQYDFTERELDQSKVEEIFVEDMLRGAKLLSDGEGRLLMGLFLYFAEQAHFNHLQDTTRPDYTWDEYSSDLCLAGELWRAVLIAFRNTILRLDFKENWQEVDINFNG